ncbi:MAG: DUF4340 domain-containing protein [Candidatus Sumerlaeia bacterium]
MKIRTIIILLISLVVLCSIYYMDYKRKVARQTEAVRQARVLPFSGEALARLEVKTPTTEFTLEKRGDNWWLVEPVEELADQKAMEKIVEVLGQSGKYGGVEISQSELEDYGLLKEAVIVEATDQSGEQSVELIFGADAALKGEIYMSQGDKPLEVFVTQEWLRTFFDKPLLAFRSKAVLPFDAQEVKDFEILRDESHLSFQKVEDKEWGVREWSENTSNTLYRARAMAIKNLIEAIHAMPPLEQEQMDRVRKQIDQNQGEKVATVVFRKSDDQSNTPDRADVNFYMMPSEADSITSAGLRLVENLDASKDKPIYLATVNERDILFKADPGIINWLGYDLPAYRSMEIMAMDLEDIAYLQIQVTIGTLQTVTSLEKRKEGVWVFAAEPDRRANADDVIRYLSICKGLQAEEALTEPVGLSEEERGLEQPLLRVSVANEDRTEREGFAIGQLVPNRYPLYYGRRQGDNKPPVMPREFMIRFSNDMSRELLKYPDSFQWIGLFAPDEHVLTKMQIAWSDDPTTLTIERPENAQTDNWAVSMNEQKAVSIPHYVIEPLIKVLQGMDFDRKVTPPADSHLERVGLKPTKVRLTLFDQSGLDFAGLDVGLVNPENKNTVVRTRAGSYYEIQTEQLMSLSQAIQLVLEKLAP